jgi:hypothetical protein
MTPRRIDKTERPNPKKPNPLLFSGMKCSVRKGKGERGEKEKTKKSTIS